MNATPAQVVYLVDTATGLLEECVSWEDRLTIQVRNISHLFVISSKTLLQIDFALGVIFSLHFLLRLVAAEHFTTFLSTAATIVDIVTLPPLFLSVWLGRTWLGLRCFRFFIVIQLPNVLVYVRLLQNSSSIRFAQVTKL